MKIPEQVQRLALVIGVIVAVVVVGRFVVMPKSLVNHELHVAATVIRESARPVKFAGSTACQDCHDDVAQKKLAGYHRTLACEGCHGASAKHADDPGAVKPFAPRDRKFCPLCHAYDAARPTGFPQINPVTHNPVTPCVTCHNPHDPVPPVPPAACSGCHAQIEHTKAVSSHAALACTTCHTVPDKHMVLPRTTRPTKPQTRDFCGTCHGTATAGKPAAAAARTAPKVDMSTHGGTFPCWQCHYPHLPEGRT